MGSCKIICAFIQVPESHGGCRVQASFLDGNGCSQQRDCVGRECGFKALLRQYFGIYPPLLNRGKQGLVQGSDIYSSPAQKDLCTILFNSCTAAKSDLYISNIDSLTCAGTSETAVIFVCVSSWTYAHKMWIQGKS